jgi:SAM-dependent methyltransferase
MTPKKDMVPYGYFLKDKKGLEVGGPSPSFFPLGIYTFPRWLDNVNFGEYTLWGNQTNNSPYIFPGKSILGKQIICDGVDLTLLEDKSYDFIFASHVLEHMVNPLKAIKNWKRVVKDNGFLIIVVPWKENTFDRYRPITSFDRLLEYFNNDRREDYVMDLLPEILETYDFSMDPGAGGRDNFIERCRNQYHNRALHVHVFDFDLITQCLNFFELDVVDKQLVLDCHQIILAKN